MRPDFDQFVHKVDFAGFWCGLEKDVFKLTFRSLSDIDDG